MALSLLVGACVAPDDGARDGTPDEASDVQDINGPTSPASRFQLDRAVKTANCTATRIASRWAVTALHCMPGGTVNGSMVTFYSNGPDWDTTRTAQVVNVIQRPGTSAAACLASSASTSGCNDSSGLFSDIILLQLANDVDNLHGDTLDAPQAVLAWSYPGTGVAGQKVGSGLHDNQPNPDNILLQVPDTTSDSSDSDGGFHTGHIRTDYGDSGGPFYVNGQILGTLFGVASPFSDKHASIPKHLDWILSSIGYVWRGTPPQPNVAYAGSLFQSFASTERVCQYACENTSSCQAYNYLTAGSSCGLYTSVTSTFASPNTHSALHYGQGSGRTNEVEGYVRSDGLSAVVHKASDGSIHELISTAASVSVGSLSQVNPPPPLAVGKLSGYRRSDGTNAVVYRSAGNRIIELALGSTGWAWNDLTSWGGQTPVGDPVAYVRADNVNAVVFRSGDGHINELHLATRAWIAADLTIDGTVPVPATSDPSAFITADGYDAVVFQSGNQIFEIYKTAGAQWDWGEPSALAGAPAAASKPYGYTHHDGTSAIVYASTTGHIIELWLDGAGWHQGDITSGGPAAAAGASPVANVRTDAVESVTYRSSTNQLEELTNTPWQAWNLSQLFGAPTTTTDPSVFVRGDGFNEIVFGAAANHADELSIRAGDPTWTLRDLTSKSGETP